MTVSPWAAQDGVFVPLGLLVQHPVLYLGFLHTCRGQGFGTGHTQPRTVCHLQTKHMHCRNGADARWLWGEAALRLRLI